MCQDTKIIRLDTEESYQTQFHPVSDTLLEVPLLSTFQSNYLPSLRGQPNDLSGFSSSSHTLLFSAQLTYLYHMCKHIHTGVHMHTHMSLYI